MYSDISVYATRLMALGGVIDHLGNDMSSGDSSAKDILSMFGDDLGMIIFHYAEHVLEEVEKIPNFREILMEGLRRMGVELTSEIQANLRCKKCGKEWTDVLNEDALLRNPWKCPNGCNGEK